MGMDRIGRGILALRHFDELSDSEVADVFAQSSTETGNRCIRTLKRLKKIRLALPGSTSLKHL